MYRRILVTAFVLSVLAVSVFIFFLGRQLMYERQAEIHYNKSEYDQAAERYLRAMEIAQLFGRPRYLYMIGLCYKNEKDCDHAMDFFIQVIKEYPDSDYSALAQSEMQSCLREPFPMTGGEFASTAATPLGKAFEKVRAQYKRLLLALRDNTSGTSVLLETEYEQYKKDWTAYKQKAQEGWAQVQGGKMTPELGTGDQRAPVEGGAVP